MTEANGGSDVSQDIAKANPVARRTMDHWAVNKLIDWAVPSADNEAMKAKLRKELHEFADELAGPSPSPVEQVLAETAATSWFAFRMHEARLASAATSEDGLTLAQSEHSQRRVDRAHRRLMSTLKTLATVRRLTLPALQINLAHRQQIAQLNEGSSCGESTADR
jgi:hypothetical protein